MMQIVITLPDKTYHMINANYYDYGDMNLIIQNGMILPKGHGDLIDRRELKKDVYTTTEWNGDVHRIIYEASVDNAPTIIPADTEREDE